MLSFVTKYVIMLIKSYKNTLPMQTTMMQCFEKMKYKSGTFKVFQLKATGLNLLFSG